MTIWNTLRKHAGKLVNVFFFYMSIPAYREIIFDVLNHYDA